jgi:hypothetical protein
MRKPGWPELILTIGTIAMALAAIWIIHTRENSAQQPYIAAPAPASPGVMQIPAPASPPLVVRDVSGPLATVLADERRSDAASTEAWVAEGYSSDLQQLIGITDSASGTDSLNVNARVFSADGYAYLSQNGQGLQPGWTAEYAQLRADLNALAADTGLAPVPAPPDSSGLSAEPDTTLPWQPPAQPAGAAACTTTGTVTNSASSTGASSVSRAVRTKCGTAAATVTHKTSVSKAGTVTNTVTTTSSG